MGWACAYYRYGSFVEAADLLRATVADAHGSLDRSQVEKSATEFCRLVWMSDCRSCTDTLRKPIAKSVNKRLGFDLSSLRQHLWRQRGEKLPDRWLLEERPPDQMDMCKWIDTSVMLADSLTKLMKEEYLLKVLNENWWNYEQPEFAKELKAKKSQQRRKVSDNSDVADYLDEPSFSAD